MSQTGKKIISFMLILLFGTFMLANVSLATGETGINIPKVDRLGTGSIGGTASNIINTILTLLGLIALVIVLMGGFKWMTSGGNEEKVGEAKKLLGAGVVGIIIILAAWAISSFIVSNIQSSIMQADTGEL